MNCDRCQKSIAVNADDPACVTSLGTHHYECMQIVWMEARALESTRRVASQERRSKMMKERWEAGTMAASKETNDE